MDASLGRAGEGEWTLGRTHPLEEDVLPDLDEAEVRADHRRECAEKSRGQRCEAEHVGEG